MKQFTFSAVMANNLLTVLQGYSKTIRLLFVMFLTLTVSANAWGAEETITLSDFGWGNATVQSSITATSATISLAKNSAGTAPTYYTSDGLRIYGVKNGATTGGTISFTPKKGITISKIVFTHTSSNSGVLAIKTGVGSYSSKTWSGTLTEGSTVSLVSTNNTSSNPQVKVTKIVITYTKTAAQTYNVILSRNGVTETINDVEEGTALDDIDGTGDQGGCSPDWEFEGWSKTQRSAQNNTEVMDLVTTVDGAGPYYAVYSHTAEGGGGSTTVAMSSFSAVSGNVNNDANVSYEAAQGTASTAPAVNDSEIRIYQNGGTLTITGNNGKKLTSITIGSSMKTSVSYKIDGGTESSNQSIAANGKFTLSEIEASSVLFTCKGTDKNSRLYLNYLSVTYSGGSTVYYTTSPDCGTPTPTPTLNVDPATLTFENTTTNTSTEKTFTLTGSNLTANASLQLSGTDPGMFSLSSNSVTQSAGSINQTITVTYTPTATGSHNATLTISSTGAESKTVTLSGTGVAPAAKYTVTFNAGSGTCDDESLKETSGGAGVTLPTANPPATCQSEGWTFAGWWTEEVGATITSPGELLNAGEIYKPTSDITLYAVYSTQEAGDAFTGYDKVTEAPEDWSGKYLLSTGTYTATGDFTSGHLVRTTYTPSTEEKAEWEFTLTKVDVDGNTYGYSILFPDGSYYLGYASSTNFQRSFDDPSENVAYLWTPSTSGITNVYQTSRKIADNGSTDFRPYSDLSSKDIVYLYKRVGGGSTTIYNSNPTCLVPVWNGATIDKNSFTVNCGGRSPMTGANGAAIISFPIGDIYNFTKDITIEASAGFIVSTSQNEDANYQSSVSLSPLVGTANANTFYNKFVYVRAEAPAQSDTDLEGTITIKNNKGETLQTFSVTADVTCNKCTVQFVDRGANYQEPILRYSGETIDEAPADPEGVCTDPIHYVFDGWATASVAAGSTTYTKVTFPYTVEGNTKFYAVYRYVEDGGADSGDYEKVTSDLDDYSGDYLFVNETDNVAFDGGRNNVDDELDAESNIIEVTINDNTIASNATTDAAKFTIAKVDGGYSIQSASGYYIGRSATSNGLSTNETYSANYDLNTITDYKTIKGKGGCILKYNKASDQKRFRYYQSGQEDIALYRKAASYLYTTSPVCGPHLAITEGKDIYVTGGNAGGTRDLVIAQTKVSYKATRLNVGPTSQVPDVKVATNGITVGGVVTSDVKVTIDQTKEQQTDGTYTITGTITVQYQPSANNKQEDIQVQLAVDYNAEARDNFTVHARSLPAEFVIVSKSGDKWYALNGDMNTNAANPANGQVTLDNDANPTKATFAPCNAIYTFDGLPHTGDRTYVRFQGTDGAWLWASSGTNVGIQNNVLKTTPEGNNNAYNWKLYTQDNITYQFGNANSNRQLTLNGEKFGMYASGVQDIRILPYEAKCLYNYAPSNLKVSVLKGSYVTLTWDAVAGATKYQYSTNGTTWTDCGTEPTLTINDLTGATEYTYYIRAYHEDAGVSQECIDYAEITFTTANCDDVPSNITYTADLSSITVSWTAAASTATITYNTKEDGTGGGGTIYTVTSPYTISGGLNPNTTYYIQILAGGTCASPIIPVKTEDVKMDIVEWQPDGIVVDINTNEKVKVTLENEVSYGSGAGTVAEDLFFSKYFEANGNAKILAVYNGTNEKIDLSTIRIINKLGSGDLSLASFGHKEVGYIYPGEEIILFNKGNAEVNACSEEQETYPDWYNVEDNALMFGGRATLLLKRGDDVIDIIGAMDGSDVYNIPNTGYNNETEKPSWGDDPGWVCTNGDNIETTEVEDDYSLSTNRCLLVRKNTVVSGDNAIEKNINKVFATLCEEWVGLQIPKYAPSVDNGVTESCEGMAFVGNFNYSNYYTKYVSMGDEREFDTNNRNADGTLTVPITELFKQSCRNIKITLKDAEDNVLKEQPYKVPIMITSDQTTAGDAFLALQENLATVEIDGSGNPTGNKTPLTLEEVKEICKTCDVVIRDNATLTKVEKDTPNDHPQVNNVYIYEGASLVVPDGNYTYNVNGLSLRRREDQVPSLSVQGEEELQVNAEYIYLDVRVNAENWHWFTLPYDCDIADVTWVDGTPAEYGVDWFLSTYDGEKRAATQSGGCWAEFHGETIKAGVGYIVGIKGDITKPKYTFELRFPMSTEVLAKELTNKTVPVNAWGVENDMLDNHRGWNLVGNPYLDFYKRNELNSFNDGLRLGGKYILNDDNYWVDSGEWDGQPDGNLPYVVVPIDGGWSAYDQVLVSSIDLLPFTAYFVQVGERTKGHTNGERKDVMFEGNNRGRASIARRAPSSVSEQEEPVIVGVNLTNSKGESDMTSLVIDDKYTDEYEMNADFFKWFGDYYRYYTRPVVYTIGADKQQRAFNAINEEQAAKPVSMGTYTAQNGEYTFSLDRRSDLTRVKEVWLHDATESAYINLMQEDYSFSTGKTDGTGRFTLAVTLHPKSPTDITDGMNGQVYVTSQQRMLYVNNLPQQARVWVYDAVGKLLVNESTNVYQRAYHVGQAGVYFVRVESQNGCETLQAVVE